MPSPTFTLIAGSTLSSETNVFQFNSISQSYTDLRIYASLRGTETSGNDVNAWIRWNGATSGWSSILALPGSNTTTTTRSQTGVSGTDWVNSRGLHGGGIIPTSNGTANSFNSSFILLPRYNFQGTLNRRTAYTESANYRAGGSNTFLVQAASGLNTGTVVSSITIQTESGNFAVGSSVYLYGCTSS